MTFIIVTIGDIHYLWGIFLHIASARKAGMQEPFLVGVKDFTPEAEGILKQLRGVTCVPLDGTRRSLACLKAQVMLHAETEYVTWADSDAFFTGDVSTLLLPRTADEVHFRLRSAAEKPGLAWKSRFGGDGTEVLAPVLETWQRDVRATAGAALAMPRFRTTGSLCFFSLSLRRHRHVIEAWNQLQRQVLPERDVGVTDPSLVFYPQLDESVLNACLAFLPEAPAVQPVFRLNKERARLFMHFIAQPKPWQGWTRRAFQFFDEYVSVAEWANAQGYTLPGPLPPSLRRSNGWWLRLLIPWMTLRPKLVRRLRKFWS